MALSMFWDRFQVLTKLGEGSFGKIFKGIDSISKRSVAIKVETRKCNGQNQLKLESKVYKALEGTVVNKDVRWPKCYGYGKDDKGNNIMVMDLLGPNIEQILNKATHHKLMPVSVAYLAEKMITLVERFHLAGFIHRDLKPQNFVINYCEQRYPRYPELFLIDYGLAKSYIETDTKSHVPYLQKRSLKGTVRYSSINTHLGVDQSRRDDLQSLGYILIYMLMGELPWQNLMGKDKEKREGYHSIMLVKMATPVEELVKDLPQPIQIPMLSYMLYVSSLMYKEEPNYEYLRKLFSPIAATFQGNLHRGAVLTVDQK